MKKILFPTDFSDASNHAFIYALKVAEKMKAEIITLHVYKMPDLKVGHMPNTVEEIYDSLDLETFENYRDEVPYLRKIAEANGLEHIQLSNVLEMGDTIPVILKTAKETAVDIIVLGTKGAGWLKEIFIGSVAGEVMERATCPVLAVPAEAAFDGTIDRIAVTTDYTDEDSIILKKVLDWAKLFNAAVYCVHVDTSHTEDFTHRMEEFKKRTGHSEQLEYVVLPLNTSLEKTIVEYVGQQSIDLLAMLIHKRNFFQELFHYSQAKSLSYHTKVPILSMHV